MIDLRSASIRYQITVLWFAWTMSFAASKEPINNEPAKSTIDFKTDIRPILSNRCFACHGPDEGKVESGLRLDKAESATSPADSGATAVVPGKIERSELIRRITSDDDSFRMPPPSFGAKLTERETKLMESWIESGGNYAKHWSFDAIANIVPAPNPSAEPAWQNSAIDLLVHRRLDERGWKPSPQASFETLLRRLSLDITGLPPTIDEQKSFASLLAQGNSIEHYEAKVDELLASPAFGEHWGRKWLDLARYADSAGYADDPQRTIWGYRDWVIRAINQGMSFDQFSIEQLAGDLLPNPTDDQLVATAFHRNTLTNNEGGTNDEEFRNVAVVDRVNTTMAVWMGLTMACAQCHSHKFDPITQKEYFQVFAIFNQTEDADRTDESPTLKWYTSSQRQQRADLQASLVQLEAKLVAPEPSLLDEQRGWSESLHAPMAWKTIVPSSVKARSKTAITISGDGRIKVDAVTDTDSFTIELPLDGNDSLSALRGIQVTSIPDPSFPNGGAAGLGDGNFVVSGISASLVERKPAAPEGRYVRIELPGDEKILSLAEVQVFSDGVNVARVGKATQSSTGFNGPADLAIDGKTTGKYTDKSTTHTSISSSPWWELDLNKSIAIEQIDVWNRTDDGTTNRLAGAKIMVLAEDRSTLWESTIDQPKANQTLVIQRSIPVPFMVANADYAQEGYGPGNAIDSDAKSGWAVGGAVNQSHQWFVSIDHKKLSKQLESKPMGEETLLRLNVKCDSATRRAILSSFSLQVTTDERANTFAQLPAAISKLLACEPTSLTSTEQETVHRYYVSAIAPSRLSLRTERDMATKKLASIQPTTTVPILRELPAKKHRTTRIQIRGNYKVHGDEVQAATPSAFHEFKSTGPMDRLQFARWLMHPDNPLTARVIANRYWENFFGVGIVRSSEEFGSQGDLPSNFELLDYLANQLIRSDWDTKRFIKEIVMSAAYRQSSSVSPERFEEDPDNVFVSRGPRFRVSAEQIRDMALSAAGLLSNKMFGQPTQPPQPSLGLKAAFGSKTDWETSSGEDRYRRGIYTLWRRSNPYPSMATFDAPNREVCVLKRDRTNTPLQALVTLNDPAFIETAQGLARRIVVHELPDAKLPERLDRLFRLTLSRSPTSAEQASLIQLYQETRDSLSLVPAEAQKLATEPIGKLPPNTDAVELATWATLCNVVLNLDEFLMTP